MEKTVKDSIVILVRGDITTLAVDAIVNAANSNLVLGGGVAGAIREKGGARIQEECDKIGGTPVGTAVVTTGGDLPAKYVIHAVGPVMGSGDEDRKLAEATRSVLDLAEENGLRTIAFPAVSTGIFGYPPDRCARVMLSTTIAYIKGGTKLDRIFFCLFDDNMYSIFEKELNRLFTE